jgi:hypothetical protein
MDAEGLTTVIDVTAQACDSVELPVDQAAAPELLRAANGLSAALTRLRVVVNTDCGTPPDLNGLCMACGRKTAEPVQAHKPGCNIFDFVIAPVFRLRRLAVRVQRLGRLVWAAVRYRGGA